MDSIRFIQRFKIDNTNKKIVNDCFRLRHKVFKERLNWKVNSFEQYEIDAYDNRETWYAVLRNDKNQVIGTWRALPTTGDFMLKSVFPEMTRGELLPEDEKIWEISRFAIDKTKRTIPIGKNYICKESQALIKSFYEFSYQHDIVQLVAVTSVAAERMMKKLGVNLRRLGDGKAVKIGRVLTTAILIEIPAKSDSLVG